MTSHRTLQGEWCNADTPLNDDELERVRSQNAESFNISWLDTKRLIATVDKLQNERTEDVVAVAAEMTADIETDATKRATESDRRATQLEAENEQLRREQPISAALVDVVNQNTEVDMLKARVAQLEAALRHCASSMYLDGTRLATDLNTWLDGGPVPYCALPREDDDGR
jgi:hypothetical protein